MDEPKSVLESLPPLDAEGVLWVAALDLVPIEDRIEWVAKMLAQVEAINAARARDPGYTLIRRHWWSLRKERLWHREPEGNSPARGWLVTESVVREVERSVRG